jgi:hypothetical protein
MLRTRLVHVALGRFAAADSPADSTLPAMLLVHNPVGRLANDVRRAKCILRPNAPAIS